MSLQLRRIGAILLVLGGLGTGIGLLNGSASAQPGNNGTVKVDELDLDNGPGDPPGHNNDPHIDDCVGQVEWYGFDEGIQSATATFEVHPPTLGTGDAGAATSQTFSDIAVHGDGAGVPNENAELDAQLPFDLTALLSAYDPHPQQGFHVKLTVHTTFSQGSDVKHKVFWILACGPPPTTTTTTTTTAPTTTTTAPTTTTTAPTTTTTAPTTTTTTTIVPGVLPGVIERPTTTTAAPTEVAGVQVDRQLPRTGLVNVGLAALSVTLIVAGIALAASTRLEGHRHAR